MSFVDDKKKAHLDRNFELVRYTRHLSSGFGSPVMGYELTHNKH